VQAVFDKQEEASVDFWRRTPVIGLGACVVGGFVTAFVILEAGLGLMAVCGKGLTHEYSIYEEELHFEHEKALREMDERSRQLRHERDIEWLRKLEDFYSTKPDV
jgi:hypothetical protein